jgi:hypothetical protein
MSPEIIAYKINLSSGKMGGTSSGTFMTVQPSGRVHVKDKSVIPRCKLHLRADITYTER